MAFRRGERATRLSYESRADLNWLWAVANTAIHGKNESQSSYF
jgi:hypothetical protein